MEDLLYRHYKLEKEEIFKEPELYQQCVSCRDLFPPIHYNKITQRCLRCDRLDRFIQPITLTITNQ